MKITIIGGGSFTWVFGLVRQFIDSPAVKGASLSLMDINQQALDLVATAARVYNQKAGSTVRIETTTDTDRALDAADFVLICISTGGLDAMRPDLEIPERYQVWHTVGDTVGPGGWSRAVRNIPVFHELAARIKRRCPDAWVLNMTNPLTILTRVLGRELDPKVVGMCPGVEDQARSMAKLVGASIDGGIDYVVTGIDHGSYFTKLVVDGVDLLTELKRQGFYRSDDKLPSAIEVKDQMMGIQVGSRAIFALWREIGFLPSITDRHAVENHPWFVTGGNGELPFGIKRTSIEDRQRGYQRKREAVERYIQEPDVQSLGSLGHGDDPVCTVIEALCGDSRFAWGSNYRNGGQIPCAPEGAVVETRCVFDSLGVHADSSPMPDVIKAIVLPTIYRQEAVIDVTLTGTFDELVALVSTDPLCVHLSLGECRRMMGEMLEANRQYIKNPRLLE